MTLTLTPLTPGSLTVTGVSPTDAFNQLLVEWTQAEAYQPSGTISRDANSVPTAFAVVWPDESGGAFTTTSTDSASGAINSYTITHTRSGKTATQPAMTRDSNGAVTVKPALTVT